MEKRLFEYRGKIYHWVGEHYCGGVNKVMLLPLEIKHLHLNHEHLIQIKDDDPELKEIKE
jgi:hypothetical protein